MSSNRDEIKRLNKIIQELEQAVSRSMNPKDSSHTGGWVHVQKQSEVPTIFVNFLLQLYLCFL
jgi:hypothetical protein